MAANSLNSVSDILRSHLTKRGGVMYVPSAVTGSQKNDVSTGRHTFEEFISVLDNFEYAYRLYMENMYCRKVIMRSSDTRVDKKTFSFENISHAFGLPDFKVENDKRFSFLGLYAPFISKIFAEYKGDYWPTYVKDMKLTDSPEEISAEEEELIIDDIESIKKAIGELVNNSVYQYPNDISSTISDKSIEDINNLLELIHNRIAKNDKFSGTSIFSILEEYYGSEKICGYLLKTIDDISEKYLELIEYKRRLVFSKGLIENYPETINFFKLFYINSITSSLDTAEELSRFLKVANSSKDNAFGTYCKNITNDIRDKYAYCIPRETLETLLNNNKEYIINGVKDKIFNKYEFNLNVSDFFKQPVDKNFVNIKSFNSISEEDVSTLYEKINDLGDNQKDFYEGYNIIAGYIKYLQDNKQDELLNNGDIELAISLLFEKKYYKNYRLNKEINEFSVKKGEIQSDSPILSSFLEESIFLKPANYNFVSFNQEEQKDYDLLFQYKEQIRTKMFYQKVKEEFNVFQHKIANELTIIISNLLLELRSRGITYGESAQDFNQLIREKITSELLTTITNVNKNELDDAKAKVRRAIAYGFTIKGTSSDIMKSVFSTCLVNRNIDQLAEKLGSGIDEVIQNLYEKFDGPFLFKRMIDSDMMMKYIKANFTTLPQFNYVRVAVKSKEIAKVSRAFMNEPILKPTNGKILRDFEIDPTTGEVMANIETLGDRILENIPTKLLIDISRKLGIGTSSNSVQNLKNLINNNPTFLTSFLKELNNLDSNKPRIIYAIARKLGYTGNSSINFLDSMINFIAKSEDLGFFYQLNSGNGLLLCYFEPVDELHTTYQLKHIFTDIQPASKVDVYAKDSTGTYSVEQYQGVGNAVVSYNYKKQYGSPVIQPYFSILSYFPNNIPALANSDKNRLKVLLSGDNIPCLIIKIDSTESIKLALPEEKEQDKKQDKKQGSLSVAMS